MVITPNVSSEAAGSGAQNATATLVSLRERRDAGSEMSGCVRETGNDTSPLDANPKTARLNTVGTDALNSIDDIADTPAADAIMKSLQSNIIGQPGTAMLAQGNLSPQSVLKLLG